MTGVEVLLALALGGALETLGPAVTYRAVTLEPNERRRFTVPGLERVTGSTGACVEEGTDQELPDTFFLQASCGGVRTTTVWRSGGKRVWVLACAEDERTPALLAVRRALQRELAGLRAVTACVRRGHVELWGWVANEKEREKVAAAVRRRSPDAVVDKVETLGE